MMPAKISSPIDILAKDVSDGNALHRASDEMFIFECNELTGWNIWFVLANDITEARKKLYENYDRYYRTFGLFAVAMFDRENPRIRYVGKGYIRLGNSFPFHKSEFITKVSEYVTRVGGGK